MAPEVLGKVKKGGGPKGTNPAGKVKQRPFVGVPTTTQVAFVHGSKLFLERMSVLSRDGAGVVCDILPEIGAVLPVAFRLSTAKRLIRARGEVVGHLATSPGGMELSKVVGERELKASMGAAIGDSATAIFRMGDLEAAAKRSKATSAQPTKIADGFSVRFMGFEAGGREAVARHVDISRRLSDKLAVRGDAMVSTTGDERSTIAAMFDEGDLSKKAMDW